MNATANDILVSILFILCIGLIFYAVYMSFRAKAIITEKMSFVYLIHFPDLDSLPDLKNNPKLKGKVRVYATSSDQYAVQSKLNDKDLTNFICQEYQLNKNQFTVRSGNVLSGIFS